MAILANEGDGVTLQASGAARALLIAGQPLREPIAQYGPFVMNTRDDPGWIQAGGRLPASSATHGCFTFGAQNSFHPADIPSCRPKLKTEGNPP
jgi:hypothetical protein